MEIFRPENSIYGFLKLGASNDSSKFFNAVSVSNLPSKVASAGKKIAMFLLIISSLFFGDFFLEFGSNFFFISLLHFWEFGSPVRNNKGKTRW